MTGAHGGGPLPRPRPRSDGRRAAAAVVAAAATWGTTGTSQALADLDVSPVAIGAARTVAGASVLVVMARFTATRRARVGATTRVAIADDGSAAPGLTDGDVPVGLGMPRVPLLVAGAGIAAYQSLFFAGVALAGVAVGTAVGIGSVPIVAGTLDWLVDGRRPDRRWWLATAIAIAGCALVLTPSGDDGQVDALGVALALGAGAAYAVVTVASRRVLDAGVRPTTAMAAVFVVGALPSVGVLVATDLGPLLSVRGGLLVTWLAVVTVGLGYALYAAGLRVLPPAVVGTLTLTEPLVAAMLGVLLLRERPGPVAAVGAVLLVTGLLVVAVRPRGRGRVGGDPPSGAVRSR